ncbi:MAG TPA: lysophospholipid acyltransferase family protein [Planctomycetota bacterium]|nr:lysophospholipid acyltransferase family protein [Planctomycetota bacterium]
MSSDDDTDRPARREALWQRLAVGLLAAAIWTVGALPTGLAYAAGDALAVPWYLWWRCHDPRGKRSKGYWRNLAIAFRAGAPLGPTPPRRHLWRWSRHIAWLLIDFCRMRRIDATNLPQHCDMSEYERIASLYRRGQGLIFATGHMGVWDVSGYAAGLLGLPLHSVFRPSPLPALNRLIAKLRSGSGQTVVARKNVMWTLKKLLAERQVIGLLSDGGGKHSSVVAPFLGTPARTVATPALLHLTSGAPIAVVAVLRTGRMRYRLRVFDVIEHEATADREADLVAITTRINAALTQAVVEAPEQWFWQSRRFRHRPPGEVPGPDGLPPLAAEAPGVHTTSSQSLHSPLDAP